MSSRGAGQDCIPASPNKTRGCLHFHLLLKKFSSSPRQAAKSGLFWQLSYSGAHPALLQWNQGHLWAQSIPILGQLSSVGITSPAILGKLSYVGITSPAGQSPGGVPCFGAVVPQACWSCSPWEASHCWPTGIP